MKTWLVSVGLLLATTAVHAEVQSRAVSYQHDDVELTGYLYWDDAHAEPRPGVLVIHEWWGLNEYARTRARMLADLGFVAFAADMYGGGKVTDKPDQARAWMQEITADVEGWRERAELGLAQLKASELVAPGKVAAIGYCFGGGTVLQMAYGGTELLGAVSFHGSLPAAPEEAKGKIGTQLLVLHGRDDGFVPPDVVDNFQDKLDAAGADWEMVIYSGARHGWTNPDVGAYGIDNLKYDAQADVRSWSRMQDFFAELF
jgi:dienelactone hydrolase